MANCEDTLWVLVGERGDSKVTTNSLALVPQDLRVMSPPLVSGQL